MLKTSGRINETASDPCESIGQTYTGRSSSSRSSPSSSSSSDSPTSLDYNADCSHSRTAESASDLSAASFRSDRLKEHHAAAATAAADYIKLWEMCKPFFTTKSVNPTHAEGPQREKPSGHVDFIRVGDTVQNPIQQDSFKNALEGKINNSHPPPVADNHTATRQKCNLHESSSSSISSSMDESKNSVAAVDNGNRLRESLVRQQVIHPQQQARGEGRGPQPMAPPQQQQQLEHPRPKVVSDNTGSGGSNRDSHKTETNSTESNSNSGGDEGKGQSRAAKDNAVHHSGTRPIMAGDATHTMKQESLLDATCEKHYETSQRCHRMAVKKRKRMDQRREYEEAGHHQALHTSSSSSLSMTTQESDTPTAKYFKPVGRPITLDDALSFTHIARLVVLGASPFLVVHANAAFYRLTGLVSSSVVVNQPLSSLICLPDTHKNTSNMPLDKELEDVAHRKSWMDDILEATIQSCGKGDMLPVHIRNQCHATLRSDSTSYKAGKECSTNKGISETEALDALSCFISIRPVIREQAGFQTWGKRSRTDFSSSVYPSICNCTHLTDDSISHYVIHMKMKEEGGSHAHHNSAIEFTKMKSDTESCSSSGTKPIFACA